MGAESARFHYKKERIQGIENAGLTGLAAIEPIAKPAMAFVVRVAAKAGAFPGAKP